MNLFILKKSLVIMYILNRKILSHCSGPENPNQGSTDQSSTGITTSNIEEQSTNLASSPTTTDNSSFVTSSTISDGGQPELSNSSGDSSTENESEKLDVSKHPSDIKLYTVDSTDATKTVELNTDQYTVTKDKNIDNFYYYKFNEGANCTLIKHEDKEVWKYDSEVNDKKYPLTMNYNKKDSKINLTFEKSIVTCDKDINGNWRQKIQNIAQTGLITINENLSLNDKIILYKDDPNDNSKKVELDSSDYDIIRLFGDEGYNFKQNNQCTLIKCVDKEVWKYNSGKYPQKVRYYKNEKKICIDFEENTTKTYKKDDSTSEWKESI